MPSYDAAAKRPSLAARHSSASSQVSQSPNDGQPSSQQRSGQYKPQRHVVGRVGPRNTSFGKNLNKMVKIAAAAQGAESAAAAAAAATGVVRQHRRSQSGASAHSTPPTSPRPSNVKRNSFGVVMPRRNKSQTILKKNHSSGQLSRHGSSKHIAGASRADVAPLKRSQSGPGKAQHWPKAAGAQHTVRFDVGDDEGQDDDGWEETSASVSPTTTRSTTRQSSLVLNPEHRQPKREEEEDDDEEDEDESEDEDEDDEDTDVEEADSPPHPQPTQSRNENAPHTNTSTLHPSNPHHHPSRPPDVDIITSRLLRRNRPTNAPPQMSSVSATAAADPHLSHSQGSTLIDTPGRDLVSRFINGSGGSAGTPHDAGSIFLAPAPVPDAGRAQDLSYSRRNRSVPANLGERSLTSSPTPPPPGATNATTNNTATASSGGSTPTSAPPDPHPSRTQQKLWLQRASSNLEPQKLVPATLPRTGGPPLLVGAGVGVNGGGAYAPTTAGVRVDPRLQRQFDQTQLEYSVVRRFRNPVIEAVGRAVDAGGGQAAWRKAQAASRPGTAGRGRGGSEGDGWRDGSRQQLQSHSQSQQHHRGQGQGQVQSQAQSSNGSRRSRVSFELGKPSGKENGGDGGRRTSFESDGDADADGDGRSLERNEAEEICRRVWERSEGVGGGD